MREGSGSYAKHYDQVIFDPGMRRLYAGSDFFNLGYWKGLGPVSVARLPAACAALVQAHVELDREREAVSGAILDVGCGLGATTRLFAAAYPRASVTGVNFSAEQLSHAAARAPGLSFLCQDAARLALRSGSVERVFCVEAAFHFDTRTDFLREAYRIVQPGGRLIFSDMLFSRSIYGIPKENTGHSPDDYIGRLRDIGWTLEECLDVTSHTAEPYLQLLCEAGFERAARTWRKVLQSYLLISVRK